MESILISEVTDKDRQRHIKSLVLGFWPTRLNDDFPGPMPVSLELKKFNKLINYHYMICVKSDGTRFFMLCDNGKTFLINRKFKIYEVFVKTTGNNTFLFDGELIQNNNSEWVYIIHDCICMERRNISQDSFDQRYEAIKCFLEDYYCSNDKGETFRISKKEFFDLSVTGIENFREYIKNIDHKVDGYILTPVKLPIGTKTQFTLFKWKPLNMHTFDFRVSENKSTYNVFALNENTEVLFASVDKDSEDGKTFKEELNRVGYVPNSIIECNYNTDTKCYVPFLLRTDKNVPNSLYTIEKTMENIIENITEEELFTLSPRPRQKK